MVSWFVRINKPWLHFVVLGVVFYQLQIALFPEPKVVIGPLSETRIATLKQQWLTSTGRQPSQDQVARYIAVELDRDMLLQRAIDLDLHLGDPIVYQRLILNMNFLQFHNEGITYNSSMDILARGRLFEIDAFKIKNKNIFGFQFHPEVTNSMIKSWYKDLDMKKIGIDKLDIILKDHNKFNKINLIWIKRILHKLLND